MADFLDLIGQGRLQLGELGLAFVLSSLVGVEREIRQKSAGLRTHALVGVSAALIMLISKYGFMNVLESGRVVLDPSRVAAQIVSGIGFIGGGVIFMRRDVVRGLTTAASVWLTAALGMACGAGLPVLAVATTIGHFIIMLAFPRLARLLPHPRRMASDLQIRYLDGREPLAAILTRCSELKFVIDSVRIEREEAPLSAREARQDVADAEGTEPDRSPPGEAMNLRILVKGKLPVARLVAELIGIPGVLEAGTIEDENGFD